MITEIFVEGQRLDVTDDISSLLTFAIDDIKDFASRQTTFSKTVVLPGTANNNRIFGSIFDTGISNNYDPTLSNTGFNFNPSVSAKCIIFQDFLQTFKGTLRLIEIDIDLHRLEYQVALNGNLTGLNVALSSSLLEDLDFSAYDQQYTIANIVASWDNPGGSAVFYPHIDYGTFSVDKHSWKYQTFKPALYVKEYIDKMFAATGDSSVAVIAGKLAGDAASAAALAAGATSVAAAAAYQAAYDAAFAAAASSAAAGVFRYQCDLFNTTRFKNLIVPHNQKALQALNSLLLTAAIGTNQSVLNSISHASNTLQYDTAVGSIFTIDTLHTQFTYNGATAVVTFAFDIRGTRHSLVTDFTMQIFKNGSPLAGTLQTLFSNHGTTEIPWRWLQTFGITMNTGDFFQFRFVATSALLDINYDLIVNTATFSINSSSPVLTPVLLNDTVQMNTAIPKNVRQVDFLLSIVQLFNLYVYEDQFDDRLIHITPFIDFYSLSTTNAVDWTYKLDRKEVIKVKPMSELNSRLYNFNYNDDSDYYNDLYKKRYNQGYGSLIFDSLFEFATQTNTIKLAFASTPLVGYGGEDKVYPTIFKRSGDTEETIDSVIRIMQTKKLSCESWDILAADGVTILDTESVYAYAGHLDDPNNPDNDLNFGALNELFFILAIGDLSKTQFNIYWSAYMAEITDKDSKLLTAKLYLTPIDIFNLNFSQYVYVDGVLFRLNKITDYNVSMPSDCEVELLKVINTTYSYPIGARPESERTIDWETDDELEYTPGNAILYL